MFRFCKLLNHSSKNNTMKKIVLSALLMTGVVAGSYANQKVTSIKVKASIYCDHCKKCESCGKRLEDAIYSVKGVKRVDLNESEKSVVVTYNTEKTNQDAIKTAITKVGFDADDQKGNPEAYAKWDNCCKKQ